jgi:peptide/nickel transport system ATP-binding protein
MANGPALLIADEPTTALDLATRTAVLELLREVQQRTGAALLLITHDMGVVAQMTERVVIVGRGGRVIEQGDTADVCARPRHPEAVRLISSVHHEHAGTTPPQLPQPRGDELLLVQDLTIRYSHGGRLGWFARGWTEAVRGVGFSLRSGETFAVVGESGGGKSTLGRALVGLERPHAGRVVIAGCDITRARGNRLRAVRASIQLVFQDPGSSLNPRLRIGTSIAQPLHAQGRFRELGGTRRVRDLLAMVELPDHFQDRFPHELSGGERQRVAIARALGLDPRILVLDEPVTALDAAARGGIMRLLRQLQMDTGFACVLIAHDLGLVRGFAHETAVMRAGRFVEVAATDQLFTDPQHEYTRELLSLARPCACCAVSLSGARAEPLRS